MLCIQTGKSIQDTNRMKFHGTDFFVKSHKKCRWCSKMLPQVLSRTLAIAERCNLKLEKVSKPFPHFDVPTATRWIVILSTLPVRVSPVAWKR